MNMNSTRRQSLARSEETKPAYLSSILCTSIVIDEAKYDMFRDCETTPHIACPGGGNITSHKAEEQ